MKLHFQSQIKNTEIVHYHSCEDYITSYWNIIKIKFENEAELIIKMPTNFLEKILGRFRLLRRLLRYDKCNVFIRNDNLVIIRQGCVYSYSIREKKLRQTLKLNNCRNILHQSLGISACGKMYFGEYGNNADRKPVNIYCSENNGTSWRVIYQFKESEIKHIHGCYYDKYENKIWTLTGDFKGENIIMKSDLDFKNNEIIGDGSQKYRAVSIIFDKSHVHWLMDSPIEKSYHISYNRIKKEIDFHQCFPGPIWYIKHLQDGYYLAGSSVEIGEGCLDKKARIFLSYDLKKWTQVAEFKKDLYPMRYFKWGVIAFSDGVQNSKSFTIFFEAISKYDGRSYVCRLTK